MSPNLCKCGCGRPTKATWAPGHACLTIEERFWPKVGGTEDPEQCWEWRGEKDRKGYGLLWMRGDKRAAAHRESGALVARRYLERCRVCGVIAQVPQ